MAGSPKPYGNVTYADPKNGKYPIDTAAHAKAAWSYISKPANAAKYPLNGVTLGSVKARIKAACKRFGIQIAEANSAGLAGEERLGGATAHPAAAEKLHEYWVHGEGAAKIKWGTPGDFDRCVRHLEKYMPGRAQGYCNLAHKAALGFYPATHAKMEKHAMDADGDARAYHALDVDVVRSGGGMELQPKEGTLGTLTGRFSEFGRWYRVSSKFEGDFLERVAPGSTVDTIRDHRDGMRVLFDHGMDAQIGNKVLGPIDVLEERSDGPYYEVPLFDTSYNRDLLPGLRSKPPVYGASMRMRVTGDEWNDKPGKSAGNPDGLPERTITSMRVMEFGPVTFPANPGASAAVRSGTDEFYGRLAEVNPHAFADAVRACGLSFEDFTGRDGERIAPGGEQEDDHAPGNGGPSPTYQQAVLRDRIWRMRRQLNG